MKRLLAIILTVFFFANLVACNESSIKSSIETNSNNDYKQVVTCIEANDLERAVTLCAELSEVEISAGNDEIFNAIVDRLNAQLNENAWFSTKYYIIEQHTIDDFKKYKTLLTHIGITSSDVTNALDFVNVILESEQYITYNDFHNFEYVHGNDITNALNYISQANSYSTLEIITSYYELAYQSMLKAYNGCKNESRASFGMKEASDFTGEWVRVLDKWRNGEDETHSNIYNSAYVSVVEDYQTVLSDVSDILDDFPDKIY